MARQPVGGLIFANDTSVFRRMQHHVEEEHSCPLLSVLPVRLFWSVFFNFCSIGRDLPQHTIQPSSLSVQAYFRWCRFLMALFSVQDNLVASSCVPFIQVSNLALECSAFAQSEICVGYTYGLICRLLAFFTFVCINTYNFSTKSPHTHTRTYTTDAATFSFSFSLHRSASVCSQHCFIISLFHSTKKTSTRNQWCFDNGASLHFLFKTHKNHTAIVPSVATIPHPNTLMKPKTTKTL